MMADARTGTAKRSLNTGHRKIRQSEMIDGDDVPHLQAIDSYSLATWIG